MKVSFVSNSLVEVCCSLQVKFVFIQLASLARQPRSRRRLFVRLAGARSTLCGLPGRPASKRKLKNESLERAAKKNIEKAMQECEGGINEVGYVLQKAMPQEDGRMRRGIRAIKSLRYEKEVHAKTERIRKIISALQFAVTVRQGTEDCM